MYGGERLNHFAGMGDRKWSEPICRRKAGWQSDSRARVFGRFSFDAR